MNKRTECILTFHGIGGPPHPLEPFEEQVWLRKRRFLEILRELASQPDVRITFDDGNASDMHIAAPALADCGLTATFFLCADRIDTPDYLTAREARHLLTMGHSIGSHGAAHRPWRRLSSQDVHSEIHGARAQIEDAIGATVSEAACPFGAYDRRTLYALRNAGFARVYTSDRRRARPDAWLAPRFTVGSADDALSIKRILASPNRRGWRVAKQWIKAHR